MVKGHKICLSVLFPHKTFVCRDNIIYPYAANRPKYLNDPASCKIIMVWVVAACIYNHFVVSSDVTNVVDYLYCVTLMLESLIRQD